ncbi:hypothetical protein [Micromonospora sp. NPDC023956]|uniref:hypothetical protein n=1 Tax=Micromonospora sp. NPDC023956 TaxID=3155722 RepID=UPI0033EF39F4
MSLTAPEALAAGMLLVDEAAAGLPFWKRGTAPERARAAAHIAAFLLDYPDGWADEEPEEEAVESAEDDDEIDPDDAVPVGPARKVMCDASPGDSVYVRAGRSGGRTGTPFVGLNVESDGEHRQIYLSPTKARAYAAGILDAADEAEGRSPLLRFDLGGSPQ